MHTRPHPKRRFSVIHKVLQLRVVQHALRAYRRSVRRIAGGSGRVGSESVGHARPDGALHAVGADDHVAIDDLAGREYDVRRGRVGRDADDTGVEAEGHVRLGEVV